MAQHCLIIKCTKLNEIELILNMLKCFELSVVRKHGLFLDKVQIMYMATVYIIVAVLEFFALAAINADCRVF